jgi:hypothetical protein
MTRALRFRLYSILAVTLICVASCVPRVGVLHHSPDAAAEVARKFAEAAFVERDNSKARELLVAKMQEAYSAERLETELEKIHPSGYPTTVSTTDFEPIPRQAAMSIFVMGENDSEKFYYRLVMAGTADTGYQVTAFGRGSGAYPPSAIRQPLKR